jgi:outer membrane usher protein
VEWQGFANWHDWTLQQRLLYRGENDTPWQRQETRLIRHWPEQMLQLGLGDIQYPRHGLMGYQTLTGISLATDFDLQPYRIAYPLTGQQFFLEEDAEVSLLVNGNKRHHLKLSAGPHEISDLPLSEGINQIVLEIEDRLGRRSVLDFSDIHSKQLLAPGLSEYAATLGIPRFNTPNGFRYDTNNLIFSGFYQHGITPYVTMGGHLEADKTLIMGGLNGAWTSQLGTIDYDLAWSQAGAIEDWATQLGYQYRQIGWGIGGHFSWQGEHFAKLGQAPDRDNQHWSAQMNLSPPRLGQWALGYSHTVRQSWSGEQTRQQRISLYRHFKRDWSLQILWSKKNEEQQIALQLSWSPTNHRWRNQLDYSRENSRYELRYVREQELGLDMTAALSNTDTQRAADLRAQYINNYLETRLEAKQILNEDNYHQQTLTISSSLVYTGGEWGISRPLNGQAFALLKTENELCGGHIQIKRGAGTQIANVLRHPNEHIILPTLNAYYLNPLKLDSSALPIGIDLEKDQIDLFPRAYSGTLVIVKTNRAGYLLGTLLLPSGKPVSYQVGTLHHADNQEETITDFFTDETGYFEFEAPESGDYVLKLSDYQAKISVPQFQCEQIEVELGNVTLHEVK